MDQYTAWASVPEHLKTKTQLGELGLRPAKGQESAAVFVSYIRGRSRPNHYHLYDLDQAAPKRKPTPEQLAHLEAARQKSLALRTCQGCGETITPDRYSIWRRHRKGDQSQYRCRLCGDRDRAAAWARQVLADPAAVILDTETTGLGESDQVLEIAIIDPHQGRPLLDTLVRPTCPIHPGAGEIHGLWAKDLESAPTFPEVYPELRRLLKQAGRIVVYNAAFDHRLLNQTRRAWKLPLFKPAPFECAMHRYAAWYGDWSDYHHSYKWQPLRGGDHRALGDCRSTLEAIKERVAEVGPRGV